MASDPKHQVGVGDRLSQLPDQVLAHILSFLPTFYSAGTMVLSKRWLKLYTIVPTLDFNDRDFIEEPRGWDFTAFANLVDAALSSHNSSTPIRKFRLHSIHVSKEYFSRVRDWLCSAVNYKIQELDLYLRCCDSSKEVDIGFELPRNVNLSETLEVFKVDSNCITYPPTDPCCFPSLKFAKVCTDYGDQSSLGQLFCNCPVLEELSIDATYTGKDAKVHVLAPELKRLITFLGKDKKGISIDAPKLERLDVNNYGSFTKFSIQSPQSLVKVSIKLEFFVPDEDNLRRASALLAEVSSAKSLYISGGNFGACSLPIFSNLKQLMVHLGDGSYLKFVMDLLKQSPNLEDLILVVDVDSWRHEYDLPEYKLFTPPYNVPVCLLSHLKTISISEMMAHDDELDMVKYLLKYSQVLEKMTISTSASLIFYTRHMTEETFMRKILKYQKSSKSCAVVDVKIA